MCFNNAMSALVRGEKGMRSVLFMLRCSAEYCEKRWKRKDMMGNDFCRLLITRPMSSANARRVEELGSEVSSCVSSMSMHNTNKVGESGHPCLTPDCK